MPRTKSKLTKSEFTTDVWAMRMWLLVRARLAMRSAVSLTEINIPISQSCVSHEDHQLNGTFEREIHRGSTSVITHVNSRALGTLAEEARQ